MWKIDNSPIIVQTDNGLRWMGLCNYFNRCGNYLLRDQNRWRDTNKDKRPICSVCTLRVKRERVKERYWRLKAIKEAKKKGITIKVKQSKNHYYDAEVAQADLALANGLFSNEDYEKEIAYLKKKYKRV